MKIQTFSIVAGSSACNAECPYCVSRMTPSQGIEQKEPEVNWRNFKKACSLAKQCGTTTAMITGKGEPTLFPEQITKYMSELEKYDFPMVEMQTNGIAIADKGREYNRHLGDWYEKGMTTIALSIIHYEPEKNKEIFLPQRENYIDIPRLSDRLHDNGFSVRLSCVLADGYICDSERAEKLIDFAKENKVEQLTIRPVNRPKESLNKAIENWVDKNYLKENQAADIRRYLESNGHQIMKLYHGASVYDVRGQNVCMTSSLTIDPQSDEIRQLIFFPDGHLRYDWQYEGAILL